MVSKNRDKEIENIFNDNEYYRLRLDMKFFKYNDNDIKMFKEDLILEIEYMLKMAKDL